MNIALIGGSGFVGSYLIDELLLQGVTPTLLIRPRSEGKIARRDECKLVQGDIHNTEDLTAAVANADCIIYCVGILRAFPTKGIDFYDLQTRCLERAISAAQQAEVSRFILISANGARANGTPYQDSKYRAEQALINSELDWTIFRPSVIFGDPRGLKEFATQLLSDIINSPIPAPLFFSGFDFTKAGELALSPVAIEDVARAVSICATSHKAIKQTITLGGSLTVSWKEILETITQTTQRKKLMLPVPAMGVKLIASLLDRFENLPITRDQLTMLLEGNTCSTKGFESLGIEPKGFTTESLAYLKN